MNYFNEVDSLFRRLQALAHTNDIAAFQQHFDDGRTCGRRTEARLFHRVGQLSLVQALACRLHRGQERAFRESLGGPGLLFPGFDIYDLLELSLGKTHRQDLLRSFLLGTTFRFSLSSFRPNVQDLPTYLLHDCSGGSIAVDEFSMRNGGNHSRDSLKVIVMPHHEEAAADKTVNLAFLFRELGPLGRSRIGNDGVVVTDLTVVDITLSQGPLPRSSSQLLLITFRNCANNA